METKIYHGEISPNDFAHALIGDFNRGNLRAHQYGQNKEIVVLVTDTPDEDIERSLQVKLKNLTSLQSLSLAFGYDEQD